ncbi:MAG: TIGR04165 family Cys-rich peptide [Euryarchaeota archaeon]|jgi:Cys-rich peptide (TIGR04165 family)|uniref:TIGR04165 family Cys-rich peptide n=1 Tax=Methanobacterium sp. MZD130B TaxID=3394378 RepID=UPI001773B4C0|nr:TIGR04165 family Cys-rich peptide [Euryarchaeota archaeon]HHT19190.1 TIGR04165 family Cys-rich peptide [Methanobacterium sp.]
MKTEKLKQKCPKCGCKDKNVSQTKKNAQHVTQSHNPVPHFDVGVVGVIRCSECGHIFEYCKDQKLKHEVKKIQL